MDEKHTNPGNASIAIAALVTTYARLKLYDLMKTIETNRPGSLLYTDTDSVIFYRKLIDARIRTSDYLGELTDEITGEKMKSFCSLGPKNYAYETLNSDGVTETIFKIKSIKLTSKALKILNFKKVLDTAVEFSQNKKTELMVPQLQFLIK